MKMTKTWCLFPVVLMLILVAPLLASAAYPEKPVNMIIAFTAGGSSDVQARIMQKYWNKYVNQPWVFVYKPGAGGIIGFTEIAKAKADGYTIGGLNVPHMVLQNLMFLEFKRLFPEARFSPVFYKGAADQNAALLGGEVDLMFGNINDVMRSIDEFNVLNVASEERNAFLPEVPTLKEQHVDFVSDIRRVFAVPKNVPADRLTFLREVFRKICADPEYLADMKKAGQPEEYLDSEATHAYILKQEARIRRLLEEENLLQ